MNTIGQIANNPHVALPQEVVPSETCTVSNAALTVIKTLGLLLMAAGAACFLAGLHLPAIALLVMGAAALILGLSLKEATSVDPASGLLEADAVVEPANAPALSEAEVILVKQFIRDTHQRFGDGPVHLVLTLKPNEPRYVFRKTAENIIIQDEHDFNEGRISGICLSNDQDVLSLNEERESVYQHLTTLSHKQISDAYIGGNPMRVVNWSFMGYYRNFAFPNFQKALMLFSLYGDLDESFSRTITRTPPQTDFAGDNLGSEETTVREIFRSALDVNEHGSVRQQIQAIENDPHALQQWKNVAAAIKRALPIIELILQREQN